MTTESNHAANDSPRSGSTKAAQWQREESHARGLGRDRGCDDRGWDLVWRARVEQLHRV